MHPHRLPHRRARPQRGVPAARRSTPIRRRWTTASPSSPGCTSTPTSSESTPPASRPGGPARTQDLSGLPDAWIGVGGLDLFLDEDLAYADRLREAGARVAVRIEPGMYHGADY